MKIPKQAVNVSFRRERNAKVLEYLFWGYLVYSYTAVSLKINIPYLALGWLVFLAMISFLNVDWKKTARIPMQLTILICCLFLLVQFLVHGGSLSTIYMESFILWPIWAVVVFNLSERPGFIKRLAVVMLLIALFVRLFVTLRMDIVARQQFESGTGLDNSNDYAAWMGFSALVFWLWGWKSTNRLHRFVLLTCFVVASFFMVGTVSRGALLSLVAGIIIGLRDLPKKKWLGIVSVLGISVFLIQVLSNNTITNYQARLYEESGRLSRWPIAIRSVQLQPLVGYGLDRVAHKGAGIDITPHNGILFMGLASGIPIALLFVVIWILAISRSYKNKQPFLADIDPLPLILFAFLEMMQANLYFMSVWALAALFYCFRDRASVGDETVLPVLDSKPNNNVGKSLKAFR